MARLSPLPSDQVKHLEEQFERTRGLMGFVPNSMPTMAHVPGLAEAFSALGAAVFVNSGVSPALLQMVAQITSSAAGCRYCQAHTASTANRLGISEEKLGDLWLFETSEHFDAAERAALRLAFAAGSVPNAATDEHFDELRRHFTEQQIAGIVGTISMFGFLNRWNDTMATDLEAEPLGFAGRVLADSGWEPGNHVTS